MDTLDKNDSCPGRMEQDSVDFITLLKMVGNLKLINHLFLEFSVYYFWTMVD
jgi:hypothetical protein